MLFTLWHRAHSTIRLSGSWRSPGTSTGRCRPTMHQWSFIAFQSPSLAKPSSWALCARRLPTALVGRKWTTKGTWWCGQPREAPRRLGFATPWGCPRSPVPVGRALSGIPLPLLCIPRAVTKGVSGPADMTSPRDGRAPGRPSHGAINQVVATGAGQPSSGPARPSRTF
jgi:hypothetical protein